MHLNNDVCKQIQNEKKVKTDKQQLIAAFNNYF